MKYWLIQPQIFDRKDLETFCYCFFSVGLFQVINTEMLVPTIIRILSTKNFLCTFEYFFVPSNSIFLLLVLKICRHASVYRKKYGKKDLKCIVKNMA